MIQETSKFFSAKHIVAQPMTPEASAERAREVLRHHVGDGEKGVSISWGGNPGIPAHTAIAAMLAFRALPDEALREALTVVADAMLDGGDGQAGDYGWSITKLNRARPLIRAALQQGQQK